MTVENDFAEYYKTAKELLRSQKYLAPVAILFKNDIAEPFILDYTNPFTSSFSWFKAGVKAKNSSCDAILLIQISAISNIRDYLENFPKEESAPTTGIIFAIFKESLFQVEFLPFSIQTEDIIFSQNIYAPNVIMIKDISEFIYKGWFADTSSLGDNYANF